MPVRGASDEGAGGQLWPRRLHFFAPEIRVLPFPAWDCLPYDRVSPKSDTESRRLATLAALAQRRQCAGAARDRHQRSMPLLQRACRRGAGSRRPASSAKVGAEVDREALVAFLAGNGYVRAGTVREPGEFSLRGGIVDL